MKIDFNRTVELLKTGNDIAILTHANPDGDTLGGGYALMLALRQLGKRVKLINNDPIGPRYAFLAEGCENDSFEEEFVISVDVADIKLLGKETEEKYADRIDLAIDHHSTNRLFAKESYVDGDSASACEIVYSLIKAMGAELTKEIADRLYTGCSTDTGCFRYSNVTAKTHLVAADLIEKGADHGEINVKMFETKTLDFIRLEQKCLNSLETYFGGKVSVITITRAMLDETNCSDEDCDSIVALTRQIKGVRAGITFKEKKDGAFKVSVRTHEEIDAAAICAHFGGGGHMRAAGCQFECGKDEALKQLLAVVEKYL